MEEKRIIVSMNKLRPLPLDRLTQKFIDKFWNRVNKTNTCWLWQGTISIAKGYAIISFVGTVWYASRFAYYFRHRVDPYPLLTLHTCDNRICVNPTHLFLGTEGDNTNDMVNKGRAKGPDKGTKPSNTILDEYLVSHIKWYLSQGYQQRPLAKFFGVSQTCITDLNRGKTWKGIVARDPKI